MANDAEERAKNIAIGVMAQGDLDRLQSYLQRGRPFEFLGDEDMTARWVGEMRRWAKVVGDRPRDLDDLDAEYRMRHQEAPYHLVVEEVEAITSAVSRAIEAMTEDEKEEANARIVADFEAARKNRN